MAKAKLLGMQRKYIPNNRAVEEEKYERTDKPV